MNCTSFLLDWLERYPASETMRRAIRFFLLEHFCRRQRHGQQEMLDVHAQPAKNGCPCRKSDLEVLDGSVVTA
jgi:hypothetical protein